MLNHNNADCNGAAALIIQPGALGDSILTIPLARMIRRQLDVPRVHVMGHERNLSILPGRSEITGVISLDAHSLHPLFVDSDSFDLPESHPLIDLFGRYQLIVSFLSDRAGHFERNLIFATFIKRSAEIVTLQLHPPGDYTSHVTAFFMEQLAQQIPDPQLAPTLAEIQLPLLQVTPEDRRIGWQLLAASGIVPDRPVVILHPGSGALEKCLPAAHFVFLAEQLADRGVQCVILLGPAERDRWAEHTISQFRRGFPVLDDLSTEQLTAVLSCGAAYVGNDSGPSHLAGAMDIPSVVIFGPSNPTHWRPLGRALRLCQADGGSGNAWPSRETVLEQVISLIS